MKVTIVFLVWWALLLHAAPIDAFQESSTGYLNKPKPMSVPTAFGGYIGSLSKAPSKVVVPATAKMPQAPTTVDTAKLRTVDHAVPAAAEMAKAPRTIAVDTTKPVSSTNPKPTSVATAFGGYIGSLTKYTGAADMQRAKTDIWDRSTPIILQGGSLRTWSETTGFVERVQVLLKTEGRALNANVELWNGPNNIPVKLAIYSEDGGLRPFSVVVETPTSQNTIAIRNTGQVEFPLAALVKPNVKNVAKMLLDVGSLKTIQGGAVFTYPFDHSVASVQVLLQTGGRPLNARIELLQGPNSDKHSVDIYTEDGLERPFFAVIETPGTGNVVRVVNRATVEFPLTACVQAYSLEPGSDESGKCGLVVGGTSSFSSYRDRLDMTTPP
jgi:hypothetical protein